MTFDREVEHTKSVTAEGVCAALQDDGLGSEARKNLFHHWFEGLLESEIINALVEREIH